MISASETASSRDLQLRELWNTACRNAIPSAKTKIIPFSMGILVFLSGYSNRIPAYHFLIFSFPNIKYGNYLKPQSRLNSKAIDYAQVK